MSGGDPLATWRNLPLDRVAAALGYRQDPADRARFRREGSVISINGEKFFDHLRATGGGGAIDLVIHATGWRFPDALRFLARHQGRGNAAALKPAPRPLRLPKPSQRAWPRVRDALVRQRALRADVLEACHRRGLLYADDRLNAVFVCRNASANPTGAEVLGTEPHTGTKRFRAMAPGSRKARGGFWLHCDRIRPALVILTESAVDTLSARSLRCAFEGTRESGAVVASTAGIASSVPSWIEQWKPKRIVCAYDADSAGDDAAERLAASDPRVIRLRPRGAKDWNEILLRSR